MSEHTDHDHFDDDECDEDGTINVKFFRAEDVSVVHRGGIDGPIIGYMVKAPP